MKPKGHQPQHSTDHHIDMRPTPKRSSTKVKKNRASARGTGMPMKGGSAMKGRYT